MKKLTLQSLLLAFLALFLGFLIPHYTPAQDEEVVATLADLDAIVERANNLDEFLSNDTIINDYFKALRAYYGNSFQRESFDRILEQLKEIKDKVPGFKKRIWKEIKVKGYTVTVDKKKYNRDIRPKGRDAFVEDWQRDLRGGQKNLSKDKALTYLDSVAEEIKTHDESLEGLSKKKRKMKNSKFYQELQARKELKEALQVILLEYLQTNESQEQIKSADADKFIEWLDELGQKTEKVLARNFPGIHPRLLRMLKESIPKKKELLQREDIFFKLAPHRVYKFVPVKRRIHGIWKGVTLGECVGGNCQHLKSTSPARWASSLLKGAVLYNVEGDGRYVGFIQKVSIRHKENKQIYVSVDFGAPVLSQTAIEVGSGNRTPLYSLWLPEASKHLAEGQRGLLVGESNHINNAKVLDKVRLSPSYALASGAGHTNDFEHVDKDFSKKIVEVSEFNDFGKPYKGSMIFDAAVPEAGQLVCLDYKKDQSGQDIKQLFKDVLEKGTENEKTRALNSLYDFPLPEVKKISIRDLLERNINNEERSTLTSIVAIDSVLTKLLETKIPKEFFETIETFSKQIKKDQRDIRLFHKFVRSSADHLIDIGAAVQEFRKFINDNGTLVEDIIEMKEKGLKLVKKSQDYLDLIRMTTKNPSDVYKLAMSDLIIKTSDLFFSLAPTELQITELGSLCIYPACSKVLLDKIKKLSKTPQRFIDNLSALRPHWGFGSDEFKSVVDDFIQKNLHWFDQLTNSGEVYRKLSRIAFSDETVRQVRVHGAQKVESIAGFIDLFNDISVEDLEDRQDVLALALADSLSLFYRLNPSEADIRRLETVVQFSISGTENIENRVQDILRAENPARLIKMTMKSYKEMKEQGLAKVLLKRELRRRITEFLSKNPSFKQRKRFIEFLGGSEAEIKEMVRKSLKDAKKTSDYLTLIENLKRDPLKVSNRLVDEIINDFTDSFMEKDPSPREMRRLSFDLKKVSTSEKIIKQVIARAKSTKHLTKMLKAIRFHVRLTADYKKMFDRLLEENFEKILKLDPSISELRKLAELTYYFKTGNIFSKIAIDKSKSLKDFSKVLSTHFLHTKEYRSFLSRFSTDNVDIFISKFHEVKDLKWYEKKFVRGEGESIEIMRKGIPLVRNADDYLKLVSFTVSRPSDERKKYTNDFIDKTIDVFFEHKPSVGQIRKLMSDSISNVRIMIKVLRRGLQVCETPQDFLDLVQVVERNPSKIYKTQFGGFLAQNIDQFFSYSTTPTIAQIIKLIKRAQYFEGKMAVMKAASPNLKSSREFIKLFTHVVDASDLGDSKEIDQFLTSLLPYFVALSPSYADIKKLSELAKTDITIKDIIKKYLGGEELKLGVMDKASCFMKALAQSFKGAL